MRYINDYKTYMQNKGPPWSISRKVTVDAGFTCPNIDGSKARGGCVYCNNAAFSPAFRFRHLSITEQLNKNIPFLKPRYKVDKFMAYFQPFSNTYAPVEVLEEKGAERVMGIDIIEPPGGQKRRWDYKNIDLDAHSWPSDVLQVQEGQLFDLIFAFDILEHLSSPYLFLKNCRGLLDKGAHLVLTTPNVMSWERWRYPKSWSGVRDIQHKHLFTRYSLQFLLEKVGFREIAISAPLRSLSFLGPLNPQVGGQILVKCQVP